MTVTKPDLSKLLQAVELCRSTIDSAQQQLVALEKEVRRLSRGDPKVGRAQALQVDKPRSTSKVQPAERVPGPISQRSTIDDRTDRPADSELVGITCPECGAAMQWRRNTRTNVYFAGCENFRGRQGCRGTRTRLEVDASNAADRDGERCQCARGPNGVALPGKFCPVGARYGNHMAGTTLVQAAGEAGHPGQRFEAPPETHLAKDHEVTRAAQHMFSGVEGLFNTILDKHHGPEGVLSQYKTGLDGSLIVDDSGKPQRRDSVSDDEEIPF